MLKKPQQHSITGSIPAGSSCCELVLAPGKAKAWDYVVFQQRALGSLVEQRSCEGAVLGSEEPREERMWGWGLAAGTLCCSGQWGGSCGVTNEAVSAGLRRWELLRRL